MKAEVTKRVITMARRVASNDYGDGNGGATTRAMVAATTAAAMRAASDKEGEGGKVMEMLTRLAGKQWRRQQRGQWRWQQEWRARMRAMARAARAIAMARSK